MFPHLSREKFRVWTQFTWFTCLRVWFIQPLLKKLFYTTNVFKHKVKCDIGTNQNRSFCLWFECFAVIMNYAVDWLVINIKSETCSAMPLKRRLSEKDYGSVFVLNATDLIPVWLVGLTTDTRPGGTQHDILVHDPQSPPPPRPWCPGGTCSCTRPEDLDLLWPAWRPRQRRSLGQGQWLRCLL